MSLNDELMAEQETLRKAAAINARRRRELSKGEYACTACCDDEVEWCEPRRAGYPQTVLPCRVCHPLEHRDRAEGHHEPAHDVKACEWEPCKKRAADEHRKRSLAHAFVAAPSPAEYAQDDLGEF